MPTADRAWMAQLADDRVRAEVRLACRYAHHYAHDSAFRAEWRAIAVLADLLDALATASGPVLPWSESLPAEDVAPTIDFAREYIRDFHHGTPGHLTLTTIAALAALADARQAALNHPVAPA